MGMGIGHWDQPDDISSVQPIGLGLEDMTLNRMNPDMQPCTPPVPPCSSFIIQLGLEVLKWMSLICVTANLVLAVLVAPRPTMVLVSLSINLLSCLLRIQACEYFIGGGLFEVIQRLGATLGQLMVLSQCLIFFRLCNFTFLPQRPLHHFPLITFPWLD